MFIFEHKKVLFGLLFLGFVTVLCGCDRAVRYAGQVVDEHGIPVEGARVTAKLNGQRQEKVSSENGTFIFIYGVGPWDFSSMTLEISANGFVPMERKLVSSDLNPHKDATENKIVLRRSLNASP